MPELRVSQINGCGWCVDVPTKKAAGAGESATRINLVAAWRESTVSTEAERAAPALQAPGEHRDEQLGPRVVGREIEAGPGAGRDAQAQPAPLAERNSRAASAIRMVSPTAASSSSARNPDRLTAYTRDDVAGSSYPREPDSACPGMPGSAHGIDARCESVQRLGLLGRVFVACGASEHQDHPMTPFWAYLGDLPGRGHGAAAVPAGLVRGRTVRGERRCPRRGT